MKDQILSSAWEIYYQLGHQTTLGRCLRQVSDQMRMKEHSVLSKLNGQPAIDYMDTYYNPDLEEQINLEFDE